DCGCWNVIQVSLDSDNKTEDTQSLKTLSAKKLIDNHLSKGFCFESFYMAQGVAAIIGLESGRKLTELINILNDVSREGRKILDQRLTIGIGQVVSSITDLETSYRGAQTALGYKAMAGVGDVIFIADMEIEKEESLVLDGKMEGKLISALKFGEEETVALCAREIADKMRQARVHESQCQVYIISILNVVLKIMQRYELNNEEIFGEMADYYEILISISDADSLEKWICKTGKAIVENITDEREDSTKNMIRMAKKYINDNYSNSEISLETICSHLHMSVTYFSTIFKREVGESYTAYLTRTRLEKAAELLSTTDEKTYMIAKQVGYEEPNYFGYVFKRMYGVSPNKFRGK
ncbi:MAG: helix-turn-helix domain-containing protein, partial [Anaerotignaceae bacterium]